MEKYALDHPKLFEVSAPQKQHQLKLQKPLASISTKSKSRSPAKS